MSAKIVVEGSVAEKRDRIRTILNEEKISYSELEKRLPALVAKPNSEIAALAKLAYRRLLETAGVYSFGGDPVAY